MSLSDLEEQWEMDSGGSCFPCGGTGKVLTLTGRKVTCDACGGTGRRQTRGEVTEG